MSTATNVLSSPIEGYPRLAQHMGQYQDCAIIRRFSSLNSQNLLYLQAELVHLEKKLRALEARDYASQEGHRRNYSRDWYWLNRSVSEGDGEQLQVVLDIRAILKEYNNAAIQQSVLNRLADPNTYSLRSLQNWLEGKGMGNYALIGADCGTWGATDEAFQSNMDLLALNPTISVDPFSRWFTHKFLSWFHHVLWHRVKKPVDPESGIVSYKSDAVQIYTSQITTIIASLLPITAILVLYFVNPMGLRLGLISLFTVVFTVCLSIFTDISRAEVFIATSTFAAVQVVFISTSNGLSGV